MRSGAGAPPPVGHAQYTIEPFCALEKLMRTPLQVLTEVVKRIKARRAVCQERARNSTGAGFRTTAVIHTTQAECMEEVLDMIKDVEQGAEIHR